MQDRVAIFYFTCGSSTVCTIVVIMLVCPNADLPAVIHLEVLGSANCNGFRLRDRLSGIRLVGIGMIRVLNQWIISVGNSFNKPILIRCIMGICSGNFGRNLTIAVQHCRNSLSQIVCCCFPGDSIRRALQNKGAASEIVA